MSKWAELNDAILLPISGVAQAVSFGSFVARLVRQRRRCHEQVDHVGQHHCASVDAQQQLPVIRIRFPQSHPRNLIPALSYSLPHTLRTTPPFFTCVIEHRPPVSVSRFLYRAGSRTVFHINPRLSHPLIPSPPRPACAVASLSLAELAKRKNGMCRSNRHSGSVSPTPSHRKSEPINLYYPSWKTNKWSMSIPSISLPCETFEALAWIDGGV